MALQIIVNNDDIKDYPFPKVMIAKDSGRIVFFLKPKVGLQLNDIDPSTSLNAKAHYSEKWDMLKFVNVTNPLTLINTF
jgi:hypothetical protein